MLRKILSLLEEHRRLSLGELARALDSKPDAVGPMMELLVKKGRIRMISSGCSGGSCRRCSCAERDESIVFEPV